jgi:hypothetical protein
MSLKFVPVGGSHMSVALGSAVNEFRRRAFIRMVATSSYTSDDPLDELAGREAMWEVFDDRADLLDALQRYWFDLLRHVVHAEPTYPLGEDRVREVYADLADEHPVLRAVLSEHEDDAAIIDAVEEERILLARAAGHLHRASAATLSGRARDLLETVPAQRRG